MSNTGVRLRKERKTMSDHSDRFPTGTPLPQASWL